jgi:hypothetical protein
MHGYGNYGSWTKMYVHTFLDKGIVYGFVECYLE